MKWITSLRTSLRRFLAPPKKTVLGHYTYRPELIEPEHYHPPPGARPEPTSFTGRSSPWFSKNPTNRWG